MLTVVFECPSRFQNLFFSWCRWGEHAIIVSSLSWRIHVDRQVHVGLFVCLPVLLAMYLGGFSACVSAWKAFSQLALAHFFTSRPSSIHLFLCFHINILNYFWAVCWWEFLDVHRNKNLCSLGHVVIRTKVGHFRSLIVVIRYHLLHTGPFCDVHIVISLCERTPL